MNVIFRARKQGKTTDLIKRAAQINGQIVTNTVSQIESVQKIANDLGLTVRKPISVRQFILHLGEIKSGKIPVLVDDAEYCLEYLLNNSLAGNKIMLDTITVTDDGN